MFKTTIFFLWFFSGSSPLPRIWSVLIPVLVALLLGLTLFVSGVCDAIGGNEATVVITDFLFSHLTDKCDQPVGTLATWISEKWCFFWVDLLKMVMNHITIWLIIVIVIDEDVWWWWSVIVGGDWNHGFLYDFPFSWECRNPNWRTPGSVKCIHGWRWLEHGWIMTFHSGMS